MMGIDHTGKFRLKCSYCGADYYEEDGHDYNLCVSAITEIVRSLRSNLVHMERWLALAREALVRQTTPR